MASVAATVLLGYLLDQQKLILWCFGQLKEIAEVEEREARRCKARLQHLKDIGQPQKNHALEWNQARMDRILADHMLRCGFLESASKLAASAKIEVSLYHSSACRSF